MSREKAKSPQGPMLHWRGGFLGVSFVVSVGDVMRTATSRGSAAVLFSRSKITPDLSHASTAMNASKASR